MLFRSVLPIEGVIDRDGIQTRGNSSRRHAGVVVEAPDLEAPDEKVIVLFMEAVIFIVSF